MTEMIEKTCIRCRQLFFEAVSGPMNCPACREQKVKKKVTELKSFNEIFDLYTQESIGTMVETVRGMKEIRIHTTSVGGCKARPAYRLAGAPNLMPTHYYSAKGWVAHDIIERHMVEDGILFDSPEEIAKSEIAKKMKISKRLAEKIQPDIEVAIRNYRIWREDTKLNLEPDNIIGVEVRMDRHVGRRFVLTGAIDLLTKDAVIDFKNGKKNYQRSNYKQLGTYERLAIEHEHGDEFQKTLIFLGDPDGPEEYTPKASSIKSAMQFFNTELVELMDAYTLMGKGVIPECSPGFGCTLCPYSPFCAGI